jgi:glutamate 5-kinase
MITKVLAAKRAAGSGAGTVIAWGREPDVLLRLAAGEAHRHRPDRGHRQSLRHASSGWRPPAAARRRGRRWGGERVRDDGKSLLPIGVVEVEGDFSGAAT